MKITRSEVPPLSNYRDYKKYIRIDFLHKCIYCGVHENAYSGYRRFHIDHIKPKSDPRFSHLVNTYSNLVYCCPDCNIMKTASWPSDNPIIDGFGWLDPEIYDYDTHYRITASSENLSIEAFDKLGRWIVEQLALLHPARISIIENWYCGIAAVTEALSKVDYILEFGDSLPLGVKESMLDVKRSLEMRLEKLTKPEKFQIMSNSFPGIKYEGNQD